MSKLQEFVKEQKIALNQNKPYFIMINENIIHASEPIRKLLKFDPTGQSIAQLVEAKEVPEVRESVNNLFNGTSVRTIKVGKQRMAATFFTKRLMIDSKVVSVIILINAKVAPLQQAS